MPKWSYGVLGLACVGGVLVLFSRTGIDDGAAFASLGIDAGNPHVRLTWDTNQRQPLLEFCRERKIDPAHFTGSIMLSRPSSPWDGYTLGIVDGRLSHYIEVDDPAIRADLDRLRSTNARDMVRSSSNDWRIYNASGRFVDPTAPFTGEVTIRPSTWFGMQTHIRVDNGIVTFSGRSLYLAFF